MNDLLKYLDKDFYIVEKIDGKKQIHVEGYVYHTGIDEDKPFRAVDFTWCYLNPHHSENEYDDATSTCQQYCYDLTEKEAIELLNNYFNDKDVIELPMVMVDEDTPCGCYVDFS